MSGKRPRCVPGFKKATEENAGWNEALQILEAMSSGDTDQERVGGMRVLAA